MTNEMVLEKKSSLVMPTHYVELDRDEMSYVDGGKASCYGTFSSTDNTGANWLASEATGWFAAGGIWVGNALLCAAAAVVTSPSVVGGIILGIAGVLCGLFGGIFISLGQSAANALEDAKYFQSQGKSYKVYRNSFLGIVTGYSCREA